MTDLSNVKPYTVHEINDMMHDPEEFFRERSFTEMKFYKTVIWLLDEYWDRAEHLHHAHIQLDGTCMYCLKDDNE